MKTVLLLLVTALSLSAADRLPTGNLLRNGDLTGADLPPAPWKVSGGTAVAEPATTTSAAALRIDLGKTSGEGMGALSQHLPVPAGATRLVLSGRVRSSLDGIAILQVKLFRAGKELRRVDSPPSSTAWQELRVEVVTGEADELSVQGRYSLAAKASGQQVWFAGLKLAAAP